MLPLTETTVVDKPIVWDHAGTTSLKGLCESAGFAVLKDDIAYIADKSKAADDLLATVASLIFVHIPEDGWAKFVAAERDDLLVLRFSTQGFPPTPPQGAHAICIHCIRKISELRDGDISLLREVLASEEGRKSLRAKLIPESIADLISFEEPHRLRALHILLLGVLAVLASNSKHRRSDEARKLLGVTEIPPLRNAEIDKYRTLWRGLGLGLDANEKVARESKVTFCDSIACELGIKDLSESKYHRIAKLVVAICNANANDCTDKNVVIDGFEELSEFLNRQ